MPRAPKRKVSKQILDSIAKQAAELAFQRLRPFVTSDSLKKAMYVMKEKRSGQYRIVFPQYWAIYYHNGRDAIYAEEGKYLVYFLDPKNDPRIKNGYPTLKKQIRHLSRAQFLFGLKMNRKLEKEGRGSMAYMVFTKHVGPTAPHPFIREAFSRFPRNILKQLAIKFHQEVLSVIPQGKTSVRVRWG